MRKACKEIKPPVRTKSSAKQNSQSGTPSDPSCYQASWRISDTPEKHGHIQLKVEFKAAPVTQKCYGSHGRII